ncbi:hypothetical protein Vi05172_g11799 [Venturia inaequalis]|nr:hypothetical protein Vi05172_g11799 [Venturia inaequalis]
MFGFAPVAIIPFPLLAMMRISKLNKDWILHLPRFRDLCTPPNLLQYHRSNDVSFRTKIDQLQSANVKLQEEIEVWKDKAITESQRVKLAEDQHCGVRKGLEEQLCKMYEINQQLQEQVERYTTSTEYLKGILAGCFEGLGTALPVLEETKEGVSSVDF